MNHIATRRDELTKLLADDAEFWKNAGNAEIDAKTAQDIDARNKRIEELDAEVTAWMAREGQKAANDRRRADLATPVNGLPTPQSKQADADAPTGTIGEQFTDDAEFKEWFSRVAPNGNMPKKMALGASPAVQFKTLLTGTSSTSGGALVTSDQLGLRDQGLFIRPLTIRDLVTSGRTGSDTIEYVRQGVITNNAAPVAEATATSNGSGAKPESGMSLAIVTETVKTIAHWIPATRRALSDAPQLRTLIDNFLRYGLEEELEDQILSGNGTGENFLGLLNTPNISTQAWDTDALITTRKARTKVRTQGRAMPTAFVMHPLDWEAFDLSQDAEDRYYFGGPMVMGTPRLWGLPVIESEGMPVGTAMVADFRLAVLWDREQAQILTSDSHADFFLRNLIAVLAEMRAAFGVLRPPAFVSIDLTP